MRTLKLKALGLLGAAMLTLAACGSTAAPAAGGDPAGSVTAAFNSAESAGFASLADFACAAKKDDLSGMFGAGSMAELAALGIDPNEVFAAFTVAFADLKATEKSRDGNRAVVQVTGKATMQIDPTKFKEILRKAVEAQGQTVTDSQLDQMIATFGSSLSTTQDIDEEVVMVNEGGKWLICE